MPKARPLPADPEERRKLLARREQTKAAVRKWRKVHPAKARAMFRHCRRFEILRETGKLERQAIAA